MQKSTASFEQEFTQLESKIKLAQETMTSELAKLQQMSVKVDAIAHELDDLQHQYKQLQQEIQKCEQELDTCLLGRSTSTLSIPDKEVSHQQSFICIAVCIRAIYSISLCAGCLLQHHDMCRSSGSKTTTV